MQHPAVDRQRRGALIGTGVLVAALVACGDNDGSFTREQLLDPETCRDCHPRHVDEWASSMHAYASDDPVFRAMNERGQEEANLGDFCVKCHAPMAVAEGATTNGLNLDELPPQLKGVTCFFCHQVDGVTEDHNNGLTLADDLVMRGPFGDSVKNPAHRTAYSPLHDRNNDQSSRMCGSCHDIVTPAGVHLERTYKEWQDSFFSRPRAMGGLSCGNCHMAGDDFEVVAEFEGVGARTYHEHTFPGIDTALTEWPGTELQREQIERDLEPAILTRLCINPSEGGRIEYRLDNVGGGHMLPSGASADRRLWVELVAESGGAIVLSTGVVADDQAVADVAATDPLLLPFRDFPRDESGNDAHMFWDARDPVDSDLLRPAVTFIPTEPGFDHSTTRIFPLGAIPTPDRIEAVVKVRAVDFDLIDDLIGSGHLDSSIRSRLTTITIEATRLVWTPEAAGTTGCVP